LTSGFSALVVLPPTPLVVLDLVGTFGTERQTIFHKKKAANAPNVLGQVHQLRQVSKRSEDV